MAGIDDFQTSEMEKDSKSKSLYERNPKTTRSLTWKSIEDIMAGIDDFQTSEMEKDSKSKSLYERNPKTTRSLTWKSIADILAEIDDFQTSEMGKDSKSKSLYERNPKTESATNNLSENIDTEDLSHSGLPPDKLYHMFISYSSDDSDQAIKICNELESIFSWKCVLFERDFLPGSSIFDSIRDSMERSVMVLFILSPSFLSGYWCKMEIQLAVQMSLRIIPLILYGLDINDLPPALKPYTPIDAGGKHDIAEEIHKAFYHMEVVDVVHQDELVAETIPIQRFMAYMKNGKTTVRHAQGIVVGCAGAGKTTLLYRLMGKSLHEIEEIKSTRGLHVYEHIFLVKNEDLIAAEGYVLNKRLIRVPISALKKNKQNVDVDLLQASNERKNKNSASLRSVQNDTLPGNKFDENPSTLQNSSLDEEENDANDTRLTRDLMKEILDAKENETSVSMIDFAGQFAYYACHQIYMRSEAFYILVLDMSKAFHDVINSTTDKHQERSIFTTWSYKDYLHFWLDSIKSFGGTSAQVFVVATHAEGKNEKKQDCFWESLWTLVPENDKIWLQKCIGDKEFALGLIEMNEHGTFSLYCLKNAIVEVVSKYMDTNIEVPSAWALLEHLLKKTEKPILSISDINRENKKLPEEYQLKSQEEILDFLSFFHGHGLLLFFKEDELSSHAILGIQWFSNAFSKLIADKDHINRDCKRRYIKEWNNFNATGNLPNSLVDALWKEEPTYLHYKTALMSYMERLRMLVRIDRTEDDISWYVPCMNKKCFTHDVFEQKLEKSSVLCFRFTSFAMFVYYRLIAYCMSFLKWGVPSDKKGSQCLYHTAAIFETQNHTVVVGISDNDIQVQVLRSSNLHPEVSCEIGRAVEIAFTELTKTFDEKKTFQKGYKCLNIFCSKGDTTFIPENNVYEIKDSVIQCNCPIGKRHDIDVPWTLGFWKKAKENDMELSQNLNANHVVESTLSAQESKKRNWEMFEKLTEISRDVLQIYFDNNIPPQDLEKVLTTYKDDMKKGPYRFGEEQLRVLFPGDGSCVTSSSFDITMMYKLLRNYQGKDLPGWGKKPETEDINEVNDVERIRWYRNKIYHAVSETKVLEKDVFEKYWLDLSQAIERLSKGEYRAAMEELKSQI